MASIVCRELQVQEAELLGTLDRSERIDAIYRAEGGRLTLHEVRHEIASWTTMYDAGVEQVQPAELTNLVARLEAVMNSGGTVLGAEDGGRLVAIASLDVSGVGGDPALLKLDLLHVSAEHRGRGIGRMLTERVAAQARSLGAKALYISATPTRRTVDAYLGMGATVLEAPDPELLALEPEDVHLLLRLA